MMKEEQIEFIKSKLVNYEILTKRANWCEDDVLRNKINTCISMSLTNRLDDIDSKEDFLFQLEMLVNGELMKFSWYSDKNRIFEIFEVFVPAFIHLKKCDWFISNVQLHKKLFLTVKLGMRQYVEFEPVFSDDLEENDKMASMFSSYLDKLIESEFFGANITIEYFNKEEKFEIFNTFIANFDQLEKRPEFGDNGALHKKLFYLVKMRLFRELDIYAKNIEEHIDFLFPKFILQNFTKC